MHQPNVDGRFGAWAVVALEGNDGRQWGREPSSDRIINLQIFTTSFPMYRRSYRLSALEKVTGRYRPLDKPIGELVAKTAAVSCAKNPASEGEIEVENPYNAKLQATDVSHYFLISAEREGRIRTLGPRQRISVYRVIRSVACEG